MSITYPANQVVIRDLDRFQQLHAEMAQRGKLTEFAAAYLRLLELFSRTLADSPSGRVRQATVWCTPRDPDDIYWFIEEFRAEPSASVTGREPSGPLRWVLLLNGTLHFHHDDQSWGIHT